MKMKMLSAGLLCLLATLRVDAAMVSISAPSMVSVGQSFTALILGNDFAEEIDGGGLNLEFDPSVLQVVSVSVSDPPWSFYTSTGSTDNISGRVDGIAFAGFPPVGGNFSIGAIEFFVLGAGQSTLIFSEFAGNPFASLGEQISVDFQPFAVQAVPLPAAVWLLASGLLGLSSFVRRRSGLRSSICARS